MRTTLNSPYPFGEAFDHGEVGHAQNRVRLKFRVGEGLFSGAGVDVGTRLLLQTLAAPEFGECNRVLDLGCGYGPLGLSLAAMAPARSVDLVDRDAVAVAYSALNAERNSIERVRTAPGLGWADVADDRQYDLVVSNIPAKVGAAAIKSWLLDGRGRVADGALFAVVVISRLAEEVDGVLAAAGAEVVLRQANRGHVALHYRLASGSPGPAPGLDLHDRGTREFSVGKVRWRARTAWGLPEFDSLHHATRLAVRALRDVHPRPGMHAGVAGVGVGHGALALKQTIKPDRIQLFDRDLLALRLSSANLMAAGAAEGTVTAHHRPLIDLPAASLDICLMVFTAPTPQKVADASIAAASAALRPAGRLILAGTSTTVTRSLERIHKGGLPLVAMSRTREKGHSAADCVRLA